MQIYLFASNSHPSVTAFTSDKGGSNLPADYAPWLVVNTNRTICIDPPSERIAEAIQQHGYFLLAGGSAYSHARRELSPSHLKPHPKVDKPFASVVSVQRTSGLKSGRQAPLLQSLSPRPSPFSAVEASPSTLATLEDTVADA